MKKLNLGGLIKRLVREGLQTLPVVGTIVTNLKADTKENPKGKINLDKWDFYRLLIGIGVGYVLYKGMLTMKQVNFIISMMGM